MRAPLNVAPVLVLLADTGTAVGTVFHRARTCHLSPRPRFHLTARWVVCSFVVQVISADPVFGNRLLRVADVEQSVARSSTGARKEWRDALPTGEGIRTCPTNTNREKDVMAQGWNLKFTRPNPKGGADLQGLIVVHVADQYDAVVLATSKMQDAVFTINSEASVGSLAEHDVKPGQMLVLVEGH